MLENIKEEIEELKEKLRRIEIGRISTAKEIEDLIRELKAKGVI